MPLKTYTLALVTALVLATAGWAEPPACSTETLLATAQNAAPTFENAVKGTYTCDYDYNKTIWNCEPYANGGPAYLPTVSGQTYYEARFAPNSVDAPWNYRLVFRFSGTFGSGTVTGKYYTTSHYSSFCKLS